MKKEDSILLVVFASIGGLALSIPIVLSLPPSPPKILVRPDIPDSVFIDQAADLPEAKAFLATYSNASVRVFRQPPQPSYGGGSPESISVYYSIARFDATGESLNTSESGPIEPYANLRVWFSPKDLTLEEVWFVCYTKKSGTGQFLLRGGWITEYLQTANGYCWDDPNLPIITCTLENLQLGKC